MGTKPPNISIRPRPSLNDMFAGICTCSVWILIYTAIKRKRKYPHKAWHVQCMIRKTFLDLTYDLYNMPNPLYPPFQPLKQPLPALSSPSSCYILFRVFVVILLYFNTHSLSLSLCTFALIFGCTDYLSISINLTLLRFSFHNMQSTIAIFLPLRRYSWEVKEPRSNSTASTYK